MIGPGQAADGDAELDRAKREALDWLRRLGSGEVTAAELETLDRWRMASAAHRRAFAEANLFWDVLGKVAREAQVRDRAGQPSRLAFGSHIGRRALLAGATAATIAYVAVRPPLGLWPSVAEFAADYRTATGEQKRLAIAPGITVEMNTQTSVTAPASRAEHYSLELVSGEVAVSVRAEVGRPIRIAAGHGQIEADRADFDVRRDGALVCVTCTTGAVRITGASATTTLAAGQQVTYGDGGPEAVIAIDPNVVTAWKRGMLIFRNVPLTQVIAELNRYRPGKIILLNAALADRSVVAGFRLDQIGEAVNYLSRAVGAQARSLPGGVVLLT
jgi:transmembrane sensor